MPYAEDPKKKQDEQAQNAAGNSEVVTSGNSGSGTATAQGQGSQSSSGDEGFTNLNKYLAVNQPQSQDLQQKVVGQAENELGSAQQSIGAGEQAFQQQVQQGGARPDQSYANQTARNAQQVVADQGQLQRAQGVLSGQYKGPERRDAQAEQNAVTNASQKLQGLGNWSGRQSILQQQFNRPDYTGGQQTLDNLLLTGSQGYSNRLSADRAQYGNLNQALGESLGRSTEAVKTAKSDAVAAKDQLQAAINAEQGSQIAGAQGRQSQAEQNYQNVLQALQNGDISPEQAQALGLQEGMQTFGIDPTQFLTKGDINLSTAASPEQRAQLQALASLQGTPLSAINANAAQLDINNPYSFNAGAFKGQIAGKQAEYQNALNNAFVSSNPDAWKVLGNNALSDEQKWQQLQAFNRPTGSTTQVGQEAGLSQNQGDLVSNYLNNPLYKQLANNSPYYKGQIDRANQIQNILNSLYKTNTRLQ